MSSKLIDFIEANKGSLSECELDIIMLGLNARGMMLEEQRLDVEFRGKFESNITASSMLSAFQFGRAYCFGMSGRSGHEKLAGDVLVMLWDYLMPNYTFCGREVILPSGKRVDILAKNKNGVDVVIELKFAGRCEERKAIKQVYDYSVELQCLYGKPFETLIINSTGEGEELSSVMTWGDIGVFDNGFAFAPNDFDKADLHAISRALNIKPKLIDGKLAYSKCVLWDYMHGGI